MAERQAIGWQDDVAAGGATALACLALIGRLQGVPVLVDRLYPDGVPTSEPEPAALVALAERAGFRCRALSLDWHHLAELKRALPAIVRMRDGRSLVLSRIEDHGDASQVVLIDPAGDVTTPQVWLRAAFDLSWSGGIVLLKKALPVEEAQRPFGWRLIAEMVRGQGRLGRDLVLSTGALSLLALAPILFAQALLGDMPAAQASDTFVFLGAGIALVLVFEAAFAAVRQGLVTRLTTHVAVRIETLLFDRLLRLPVTTFETTPAGVLMHRLDRAGAVPALLSGVLAGALLDGGVLVVLVAAMLTISALLTGLVVALGALAAVVTLLLAARLRRTGESLDQTDEQASAVLFETLAYFGPVKSLALERRQRRRWDVLNARATRQRIADGDAASLLDTVGHVFDRLLVFGPVALGTAMAVTGMRPVSALALFGTLLLSSRLAAPLRDLVPLARRWNAGQQAIQALAALVDATPEAEPERQGVRAPLKGHIAFSGVTFSYPEAAGPALQAVSFTVPAGGSLGIVGRSGAGKSTVARLLQRFHPDYQGLIKVDGIDVREIDLDHLRGSVAVVTQDMPLFPGSLRESLLAGRPAASDDEVLHALRLVGAEAMVERLPRGLDTVLDERAAPLSDGQRQMVAIARALLADPAILILDEASSALDPESEAILMGNLGRLAQGRTLVVVSQRLAALAQVDAILVLDKGEVQDIGSHADLLERSDLYGGLWRRQTAPLLPGGATSPPRLRGDRVA